MRFDDLIKENPNFLETLINEEDAFNIARTIQKENDQYIVDRISYELALDGEPSIKGYQLPIIMLGLDALDTEYYRENKQDKQLLSKKDLSQENWINDPRTQENICPKELEILQEEINFKKLDINQLYRDRYNRWGWNGFYTFYIYKCAKFYIEITGKKYKYDNHHNDRFNSFEPITESGYFLLEFHNLLNRIAEKYKAPIITDSKFRTAAKFARKANHESDMSFATLFTAEN